MSKQISIVIPALNEADGIVPTLVRVKSVAAANGWELELIVVDDGSTDATGELARQNGARVIRHPMNGGYGISLQHGIQAARHDLIAITDADGTYPVEELPELVCMVTEDGFDMAVGARQGSEFRKGRWKYPARLAFRWLAEFVSGRRIPDINSGLRVFRREKILPHLPYTCMGFSFTTSITLIFFLSGLFVGYRPIPYAARIGKTKVRHFRDSLRTAQILVSVITRYNPIKLFLLLALATFLASLVLGLASWWIRSGTLGVYGAALFAATPILMGLGFHAEGVRMNGRS